MYRMLIVVPLVALLLTGCLVTPVDQRPGVVVAPALPVIVQLDVEPYYFQSGYYYYYDNSNWRYSHSRSGPWTDLPRSHYPKETRYKGRSDRRDADRDRDRRDGDRDRRSQK
jgi:hypothetical protein